MNYTGHCNPEIDELIDQQSAEANQEKRRRLVWEIERKLAEDGARPIIFYNRGASCWQPYVKGLTITGVRLKCIQIQLVTLRVISGSVF